MANTFTMIGPSGGFPGASQPALPQFSSVGPINQPPPGSGAGVAGVYSPVEPLPGVSGGPTSIPL